MSNKVYNSDEVLKLLTDLSSCALSWQIKMKNKYSLSEWQGYYDDWLKENGLHPYSNYKNINK